MFKIVNYLGKTLNIFNTKEEAELWLMHYEDMYSIDGLQLVELEDDKK